MDSSNAADWVNAWATILAFLAATAAVVIASRGYVLQRRQTEATLNQIEANAVAEKARSRRSQANEFCTWIFRGRQTGWHIWLSNASQLPVYDVRVRALGRNLDVEIVRGAYGPKPAFESDVLNEWLANNLQRCEGGPDAYSDQESIKIETRFRDAAGVQWMRDVNGCLCEIA